MHPYDEARLDELLTGSVRRTAPPFDFDTWKREHREAIREFQEQTQHRSHASRGLLRFRNVMMNSKFTKLAVAATAAAAVIGLMAVLHFDSPTAYAFEQTAKAIKTLKSVHYVKLDYSSKSPDNLFRSEFWMEFDADGWLTRFRKETLENAVSISSVWEGGIYRTWLPAQNRLSARYSPMFGGLVRADEDVNDTRVAAETLDKLQAEGKVRVEIGQTAGKDIQLTITRLVSDKEMPGWWKGDKWVVLVDPATKLWKQRDLYGVRDGREQLWVRWSWLGYNETFAAATFELAPAAGAIVDDQTGERGMVQGALMDVEAASQVVRQYIEAMVAGEYDMAANLGSGTGENLRKWAGSGGKAVRLVWIGEPIPRKEWGARVFEVPYTFEIERPDGKRVLVGPKSEHPERGGPLQHRAAAVAPVPGHPDRWMICGGI